MPKWLLQQSFSAQIFHYKSPLHSPLLPLSFYLQFFSKSHCTTLSSLYFLSHRLSMAKTICLLLLLALFVQHIDVCSSRGASSVEILRRQLFLEMKKKMALKIPAPNHGSTGNNEMPEDWQLRRVPAGPDPLHHNGQDPKKPRTP